MKGFYVPLLVTMTILISACGGNENDSTSSPTTQAPSIILFIGDGMGPMQRTAATWYSQGITGELFMDSLPFYGQTRTASADSLITDSAASATAIATGIKTNNGVIGMDQNLDSVETILEFAESKGMATGLVTTTQLPHATPAAFAAHVQQRNEMTEIARQMMESGADVLLGGGENYFIPNTELGHYPATGKRTDGINLIEQAIVQGYQYVYDEPGLDALDSASVDRVLGLFSDEGMVEQYTPSLKKMTQFAIDVLSREPNGFFLMVEGGQIDWRGHINDAMENMTNTLGLDESVNVGINNALSNANVLLIVTADHETGGMSVALTPSGSLTEDGPFTTPDATEFYVDWTTLSHTGIDVPTT